MAASEGPPLRVRPAEPGDLERVQAIYAHHVLHGLASFEETPPDLEEITRRYENLRARGLPYLVAELGGKDAPEGVPEGVWGYAYAAPYRTRPAYRYSVENSVYLATGLEGRGIGRALLEELIRRCAELGYRQMIAIIGDSAHVPSIKLHEALGFSHVGNIVSVGFKLGRWVDSVILQLPLGEGDGTLPPDAGEASGD
ncbi:MAG: N-acetyltransferase family protein [Kiloniellales bacterium]